jgi:hypothetical protein
MDKIIESNIRYLLLEQDTPDRIYKKELEILPCHQVGDETNNTIQMTPWGIFELAKQLIQWANSQDENIRDITRNSFRFWDEKTKRIKKC